jgi:hypothetical protein
MIVEELEDEIAHMEKHAESIHRLAANEKLRAALEDELGNLKGRLNTLARKLGRGGTHERSAEELEAERWQAKRDLEQVRRAIRSVHEAVESIAASVELGFNPHWGLMFKEGAENSRFGEQVEDYACLYTSRVSNFLFSSPMQYFRSPRQWMPHELGMELLSPFGSDERLPGDRRRPADEKVSGG